MYYGGFGKIAPGFATFPGAGATKASGFGKVVPAATSVVAPGFGFSKFGKAPVPAAPFAGFGKAPFAGFGKAPFAGFGKGLGKAPFAGFGKGLGKAPFGATKATGFNKAVPSTTVATTPSFI